MADGLPVSAPDDPVILREQGLALARAGDTAQALKLLARAWRMHLWDPLASLHYGVGQLLANRPVQAAALFRRAATMNPDDPSPWVNLSVALLALGHAKAARGAARRAIALAPDTAETWHAFGRTHLALGEPGEARHAFARAVNLDGTHADIWVGLGLACYRQGEMAQAAAAMRQALQRQPGHPAAEINLAVFLMLRGEGDRSRLMLEALIRRAPACHAARLNLANLKLLEQEYEAALALLDGPPPAGIDGTFWRAHRAMALLSTGRHEAARAELDAIPLPHGEAEILIVWRRLLLAMHDGAPAIADDLAARMAALAADERTGQPEHRIVGHFDLGRFHDRRDRPAAAFSHWIAGHRLLGRTQPFDRARHGEFIAAQIANYDFDRFRRGPIAENRDPAPVFVVGLPRSGTSLMEQVLAAHGDVQGTGERPLVHDLLSGLLSGLGGATESAALVARAASLDQGALDAAGRHYLAAQDAVRAGKMRVIDKMPNNAWHLGFIATMLPGARVIHCRRDPRDIGVSIFQHRFFGYHPYAHDLADLGWAIGLHARLMAHWRAVLPIPLLEIDLADWVADFPGTLDRILRFLDLPHDPACANFHLIERPVRTASARQVRRPVNAAGIGRWLRYAAQLAPLTAELAAAGLIDTEPA